MNTVDVILDGLTIGATGSAMALFLLHSGRRREPAPRSETDFGAVFGAFLAAWLATELYEVFAPPEAQALGQVVHLLLLTTLALWLNARFWGSLKRAKEAP